ncbi:MAG: YidH family protein [Sporichthyaceae bacterium]
MREPEDARNAEEADPDYRFTLANERTFLAWIRTSLGLLAGAVALIHVVPRDQVTEVQRGIGLALTALALLLAVSAVRRWRIVQGHMRRGADLPANRDPIYLSLAVAAIAVAIGVLLVWFRDQI